MRLRHAAWLLLVLWGCASSSTASKRPTVENAGPTFVEDDYGAALREAREKRLPLFVEAWAPWCQSCRAMRATVLTDVALQPHEGRFIWLAIARLAELYMAAGQLDRALEASQRALSRVTGADRPRVLATHARILHARGEPAEAERLLTDALKELERAPEGPTALRQRRVLQATLDRVRAPAK